MFFYVTGEKDTSDGAVLHSGSHYFPFEFTLPPKAPSSFKGKHGRLRYYARMTICTPGGPHPTRTSKFAVIGCLDLNSEPDAAVSRNTCEVDFRLIVPKVHAFLRFRRFFFWWNLFHVQTLLEFFSGAAFLQILACYLLYYIGFSCSIFCKTTFLHMSVCVLCHMLSSFKGLHQGSKSMLWLISTKTEFLSFIDLPNLFTYWDFLLYVPFLSLS